MNDAAYQKWIELGYERAFNRSTHALDLIKQHFVELHDYTNKELDQMTPQQKATREAELTLWRNECRAIGMYRGELMTQLNRLRRQALRGEPLK